MAAEGYPCGRQVEMDKPKTWWDFASEAMNMNSATVPAHAGNTVPQGQDPTPNPNKNKEIDKKPEAAHANVQSTAVMHPALGEETVATATAAVPAPAELGLMLTPEPEDESLFPSMEKIQQ